MKRLLPLIVILVFSTPLLAQTQNYQLDPQKSKIEWVGKKVTGQHSGTIQLKNGTVVVENNEIKSGQFTIDMKTIKVVDLTDAGANQKLTNHLNSEDFFATANHPESSFKITSIKKKTPTQIEVVGDLTIKGITNPVTFVTDVAFNGNQAQAKGTLKFDRTKYEVRYGSGKFFQGLGDKLIYDDIELKLDLTATKS